MVDQYYNSAFFFFHPIITVLVNKRLITILTTKRYYDNVITRYKHPFKPYLLITKKRVVDSIFHYLIPISLKELSFYKMQ